MFYSKFRKSHKVKMIFLSWPVKALFIFVGAVAMTFFNTKTFLFNEGVVSWSDFPNCFPFAGREGLYASFGLDVCYSLYFLLLFSFFRKLFKE